MCIESRVAVKNLEEAIIQPVNKVVIVLLVVICKYFYSFCRTTVSINTGFKIFGARMYINKMTSVNNPL